MWFIFGSLVLAGVLIGGGIIMFIHSNESVADSDTARSKAQLATGPDVAPVPLTSDSTSAQTRPLPSDRPKPAKSDLSVVSNPGVQGAFSDGAPASASSEPKPEDFSQYDKYKGEQTARIANLKVGSGAEAVSGKKVIVNYIGHLVSGALFDDSYSRNQPVLFTLGQGGVIAGWEQGIPGMKVGGKRRIVVPPSAGYGNQEKKNGDTVVIPANSLLIFDVELLAVE